MLDDAVNELNEKGTLLAAEAYGKRQTYILISSCKLFCMTAQARIYTEISKLPIVPKVQCDEFRDMAMESIRAFLLIHKTFDQEGDLRHLDYFVVVSRGSDFSAVRRSMALTVVTAVLASYPRPLPGPLPGWPRLVPAHGGLSANHPVGGFVESYTRR